MPERDDRTVFQPGGSRPQGTGDVVPGQMESGWFANQSAPGPPASVTGPGSLPPSQSESFDLPSRAAGARNPIVIGVLLNHIYRVDRFIGRGGMGEVYEGTNVNADERVAIKIMLPYLAADPNVQTLFRNEARTLVKLSHPALVQYRVLALEPELKVLYFVTEFIDGPSLNDVLGRIDATPARMVQFMRRLAAGLAVAHEAGMIHRDISPDNILLPDGQLDRAKIIDFGIAKDLDAAARSGAARTIIGSGFAGKLGFVAPEQFGDTREVGPWTDIYSLGLVILSLARRKPVDMGASFSEAIEKRRSVPDITALPENLQPVIGRMLQPDRTRRPQSMAEVLAALDAADRSAAVAQARSRTSEPAKPPVTLVHAHPSGATGWVVALLGGGILVAAMVVAVLVFWPTGDVPAPVPAPVPPVPAPVDPLVRVNQIARQAIAGVNCSWLDSSYPERRGQSIHLAISGVARNPIDASNEISSAIEKAGYSSDLDVSSVGTLAPDACQVISAFRSVREMPSSTGHSLTLAGQAFHLQEKPSDCDHSLPKHVAKVVADVSIRDPETDFSLLLVDPDGTIQQFFTNRKEFQKRRAGWSPPVENTGGDSYRFTLCSVTDDASRAAQGYMGLLLLTGKGPFNLGLRTTTMNDANRIGPDFLASLPERETQSGWKAQMAWFRILPN